MVSVEGIDHPEILMTASWCIIFGSIISTLLRRVHVILLFGIAMFGASMYTNSLQPTLQYASMVAATMGYMSLGKASKKDKAD